MDPIHIEKIQAMNNYHIKNQFLNHFFFYSSIAMTCSLVCFCSSPSLWSLINAFLFVSIPNIKNLIFTPKFLFVVCNIIVVFLIGESKLVGSKSSSPDTELYDEYVKNSKNYQREPITQVMKKDKEMKLEEAMVVEDVKRVVEENVKEDEKEVLKQEQDQDQDQEQEQEQEQGQEQEQEEEENGLAAEELNKRVEEFIARMKKQRRLEAGLLVSTPICGY